MQQLYANQKNCDRITYVKTCLPNLYLLRNCMVFDVKNDACLVFHYIDEDSDEVHVSHSLQSVILSVSDKESWLLYC